MTAFLGRLGGSLCMVLLAACGMLTALHGQAATPAEETRELELTVSDNPRGAIIQAAAWQAQARISGDKALLLKSLRLSVKAHEQVEEAGQLKEELARGLALAREMNHQEAVIEFLAAQGQWASNDGRYIEATKLFDEALELAEKAGLRASKAKAQSGKAYMYLALGRVSDALSLLVEAHAYFETHNDRLWMSNTLALMASAFGADASDKEGITKSIEYNKRAMALMDPKLNRYDLATDYHNLGVDHARNKDFKLAREYFDKSMVLARELQDRVSIAYLEYRIGLLEREQKRYKEALARINQAIPVFAATRNTNMEFAAHLAKARTLAFMEQYREAIESLTRARTLGEKLNTPYSDTAFHEAAADVHSRFGDYEKAYQQARLQRDAEKRAAQAANAQLSAELEQRFDSKQKEADNAVLRAQQKESDARRISLALALILSLLALVGLGGYLLTQRRRNQRYETLAMRDDLTGLPNRRSILEFARLQFRRRRATDGGFSLALIDIDHFKAINDEYGHALGDAVLMAFAQACQQQLRSNDRIGRFGGEEFLLVMPAADATQIPAVFERLRSGVQAIVVDGLPPTRRLTFSLGSAVATTPADTVDELIKRADQAMYRAKQGGRDRFEIG